MSTWHQKKAGPVELRGDKGWTVVSDPPNQLKTSMTGFSSRAEAQEYIERCETFREASSRHMYILAPRAILE
jgi:hypothetical protein